MNRHRTLAFGSVFALCLFFVLATLGYLAREGRLAMVPVYDDVTYLVDAMNRLGVLDKEGFLGLLRDLHLHPAHAPLMAVVGAVGFLLSAGANWGPYALNSMWVFVTVALALVVLRATDVRSQAGIVIAILAAPLFGIAIVEFRPDPVWGLLVGFSVALLVTVDFVRAHPSRLLGLGVLIGFAVLAKPTAAPASVVVILAACFGVVVAMLVLQAPVHRRAVARSVMWIAFGAAVVVTPYVINGGAEILGYIRMVMSADNSVWRTQTDAMGHATYYLARSYGTLALGWIWYAALPLLGLCLCVLVRGRDRRGLCAFAGLLCALVAAYAIVSISAVKSPMIGSILYGTIIAVVAWASGKVVEHVRVRHEIVLLAGILVFSTQWVPKVGMVQRADPAMQITDQASRAALPVVVEALRTHRNNRVVVTVPGPVYAGTLDLMALQQGVTGSFNEAYTWDTWELFMQGINTCDVVILSEAGMLGQALGYNFPSVRFQPRLLAYLRSSPAFNAKPVFTDEAGRSVWVFVRK